MEAEVQVLAENPVTGEQTHTNTAYLVYVALDDEGNPTLSRPCSPKRKQKSRMQRNASDR
jgi:acyl-CoA hydrolase